MNVLLWILVGLFVLLWIRSNKQQTTLNSLHKEVQTLHKTLAALQDDTAVHTPAPEQAPVSEQQASVARAKDLLLAPPDSHDTAPAAMPTQACAAEKVIEYQEQVVKTMKRAEPPAGEQNLPRPDVQLTGPLQVIWNWLQANPLLYAGLVLFITGIAFAISYLITNDFFDFSLEARLACIALVGVTMILTGYRLSRTQYTYGGALMGGGAAILYLVFFAAAKWGLLSVGATLIIMGLLVIAVTCLALAINMELLATLATLGGFMAPVLLSTGSGNYVGLFTFYALLCAGNVALLRFKAWDIPVLIGYATTVGVGAIWAQSSYEPSMLANIQIFTIVFFIIFNAAGVLLCFHADKLAHTSLNKRNMIHASLLFGVPLLFFSIQYLLVRDTPYALALCALGMTAWYLGLARYLMHRKGEATAFARDAYCIIALGFSALAVPLAVNALWTTTIWAVQGVGMVWLGMRRNYPFARLCGYLMQVLAALAFVHMYSGNATLFTFAFIADTPATWAERLISSVLLAASGLGIVLLFVRFAFHTDSATSAPLMAVDADTDHSRAGLSAAPMADEHRLFPLWQLWVVLWFYVTSLDTLYHFWADVPAFDHILFIFYSLTAWAWHWLGRRYAMTLWAVPAYFVLPLLVLNNLPVFYGMAKLLAGIQPLRLNAWFMDWANALSLWTGVVVVGLNFRNAIFTGALRTWALRLFTVFILCAVFFTALYPAAAIKQTPLGSTLLFSLMLGFSALALVYAPCAKRYLQRLMAESDIQICTQAGGLLIAVLAIGVFISLCWQAGLGPDPYIPLFSITDMVQLLALGSLAAMALGVVPLPAAKIRHHLPQGLALAAFILVNLSLARAICWYTSLMYAPEALMRSPLFLMALSLLWGSLALFFIVVASRRLGSRRLWLAGAALLVLTIIKMLLFDMADRGTGTRVISFIFTGVLMLFMGYYCPLPPKSVSVPPPTPEHGQN